MRELVVGDRLDRFELLELLARSGMAAIFKGRDTRSGALVALKVPYLQFESDVTFHERFRREEAIGKRLRHPNIVQVLDAGDTSRMYLAMEYVEGVSLRAVMKDAKRLPPERALEIARQLCDALAYMHANGVVHRDLKPENILLAGEGGSTVKLLDFGIALDESARRLTWFGLSSTLGTPDYMAPEQVQGRRGDVRTDVYAVGTLLFEMLTGALPFEGANVQALMRRKLNEEPRAPRDVAPDIDPQLEEIILHAIERSPRERYPNIKALSDDLADPSRVTFRDRTVKAKPPLLARLPLRRGVVAPVAFVLVVASLMTLTWVSTRARSHPSPPAAPRAEPAAQPPTRAGGS